MKRPTGEELEVLFDKDFLKLKASVSEKVIAYLADIERVLHQEIKQSDFDFPKRTFLKAGKISKGEQYQSLPYFMLDYPRLFSKQEVFAFRTMLWWGNHFSCTLHMAGPVLEHLRPKLIKNLSGHDNLYFCVNSQPWDYHYDEENYKLVKDLNAAEIDGQIEENGFVKISNFIPLNQWDSFSSFTKESFARFLQCLY